MHLLSDCDLLIVLNADGGTKRVCTYNDLSKQELDEIFHAHGALPENVQNGFSWLLSSPSSSSSVSISAKSKRGSERNSKQVESEKKNEKDLKLMTNEDRQIGFVPLDVYKWFVRTGGLCYILGMALVLFIGSAVSAASTFYLSYWGRINADAEAAGSTVSEARNLKYVNTYACIQVSNTIIHFTPLIPLLFASLFYFMVKSLYPSLYPYVLGLLVDICQVCMLLKLVEGYTV